MDSFSEYVNTAEGVMSVLGIDVMTISVLKLLLQLVVAWNYFKMLFILVNGAGIIMAYLGFGDADGYVARARGGGV